MPCSPIASCMRTISAIARSSTVRSSALEISRFWDRSRAASSSGGRRKLPTWSARNGGWVRKLIVCSHSRILEVLDLVELDIVELAIDQLTLADVDVLHDVAGRGVDRHRPARTRRRHALHRFDGLLAIGRAA